MLRKSIVATALATSLVFSVSAAGAAPKTDHVSSSKKAQNQSTLPYFVDETKLPFEAPKGYETDRYWGVHNGAGYRIEVPKDWNGELVLYAHGYRGTGLELTVTNPGLREHLIKNGYAWAASSYSTNGYDPGQGVKDTHALGTLFNGIVKKPTSTYITGYSMGGHVTAVMAEQYPGSYDGALPMCGVTGDTELFDFFTDYGLVAQALTGIEKEDQVFPATDEYLKETVASMKEQLGINGTLTEEGEKLKTITMNLTGGDRPLFKEAFTYYKNFLFDRMPLDPTYGVAAGNVVNNTDSLYQFDEDADSLSDEEKAFNDAVYRINADPQTKQKGITGVPKVSGDIEIPTLTIHGIGDLYVPFHMQQIYAQRAEENGKSNLLVSRSIRAVDHCDFKPEEESSAFDALVKWVKEGTKPEGDDILNPEVVADKRFGTNYTTELRIYDPLIKEKAKIEN